MPRKYTKHNYFSDLMRRVSIWKSIEQQRRRVAEYVNKAMRSPLNATQNEVLDFIADMSQKHSSLLALPEVSKAYNNLQELLDLRVDSEKLADLCSDVNIQMFFQDESLNLLINSAENLKKERSVQAQRISDIRAFIRHLTKQIELEQRRIRNEGEKHKSFVIKGFEPLALLSHLFMKPRVFRLRRMIAKEQDEIKRIELSIQRQAKDLCAEGDRRLPPEKRQAYIKEFQAFFPLVDKTLMQQYALHKKMQLAKTALECVLAKAEEQQTAKSDKSEVDVDGIEREKIQQAFEKSLSKKQNLILVGAQRTIGLTFSTIKEICDDEQYHEDMVGHLQMLINTPPEEDFVFHGAKRWKLFISNGNLYELSVAPKIGGCQSMPRLYFKKEQFCFDGSQPVLTNKRDADLQKKSVQGIWVAVKRGTKRTQKSDGDLARKVIFENDGERHDGVRTPNDLPWARVCVRHFSEGMMLPRGNGGNGA